MSTFSLDDAKAHATAKSKKNLMLAVGGAGNMLDEVLKRVLGSDKLSPIDKINFCRQLGELGEQMFQAVVNGKPMPAFGGTKPPTTTTGTSGDDDNDVQQKLDAANTQNDALKKDRMALREVALYLGLSVPARDNEAFSPDIAQRVKDKITEKENTAKGTRALAGTVAQDDYNKAFDEIEKAAKGLEVAKDGIVGKPYIKGKPELDKAVGEGKKLRK